MLTLSEIKQNQDLVNQIDWGMTPELAVTLYLEWGNNWSHGKGMVKSKNDVSYYFVVYSWEEGPVLHLVRRDSDGAEELAVIPLPDYLKEDFLEKWRGHKGVYSLTDEISQWLQTELGVSETIH